MVQIRFAFQLMSDTVLEHRFTIIKLVLLKTVVLLSLIHSYCKGLVMI